MISEIVKNAIIVTLGLTIISFLLIIAAMFLSIVVYIVKDTFRNDSRVSRQALISTIEKSEKNKGDDSNGRNN